MSIQLPLSINLIPNRDFDGFISGDNGELVERLKHPKDRFIYIWGEAGSGRSHLLQAACQLGDDNRRRCTYLPLANRELKPSMLGGLDSFDLVCLDDLEQVCGDETWERALFKLFNGVRDAAGQLVVSADRPPPQLALGLADLMSRLTWGPCYRLKPLDEMGRMSLLHEGLNQRGLKLSDGAATYLMQRIPRDIESINRIVDSLDQASLVAQRKLTIPFLRRVLRL